MKLRAGPPPDLRLELLNRGHPIAAFSPGDVAIDTFLHDQALLEQDAGLSRTTVAVSARSGEVVGFFSLSPMVIPVDSRALTALGLTVSVPYPKIGGCLLGRLGVLESCHGQGLGRALIALATDRARRSQAEVGGVFLAVDAKSERLAKWYATLGFRQIGQSRRLVLKL